MHLGGHRRWVPLFIWKDTERLISKCDSLRLTRFAIFFLAQTSVLKHRTQIELTQNKSQLPDHIMR